MDDKYMPPPAPGFVPGESSVPPPPPYHGDPPPPQQSFVIVGPPAFGSESQRMTCPHCHQDISTAVESEANSKTHMFSVILCVLGGCCCAFCPYCIDCCMVQKHYCPACKSFLGQSEN